ncbi:Protein RCR2 [Candida viswanathii]|uniref:Protein RCR2 n=1 Tax=Candida viswanathii TaxID=5486 RepID=A0A367XPB3_9ASCO|nr:Protein RCR2 [Candida viswanathii]
MFLFNKDNYVELHKRDASFGIGTALILIGFIIAGLLIFITTRRKQRSKVIATQQQPTTIPQTSQVLGRMAGPSTSEVQAPPMVHVANSTEIPDDFVPPYSATADHKNDLGYYDQEGKFHPSVAVTRVLTPPPMIYTR